MRTVMRMRNLKRSVLYLVFRNSPRLLLELMTLALVTLAVPAFGAADKCLAVNGIASKKTSSIVTAAFTDVTDASGNTTFAYTFSGLDPSSPSVDGIPGLITYCVYPEFANLPTG